MGSDHRSIVRNEKCSGGPPPVRAASMTLEAVASCVRMNDQYWYDLVYEGEKLTEKAEGRPRDLSADISESESGRSLAQRDAERYRASVQDARSLNPDRPEHQLQDVIDAYRWNHSDASRTVHRGIGFTRPGR